MSANAKIFILRYVVLVIITLSISTIYFSIFVYKNPDEVCKNEIMDSEPRTIFNISYIIRGCDCNRTIITENVNMTSSCSYMTSLRGPSQKIVSFGLAGEFPLVSRYTQGIIQNIENNLKMYPGYNIRIYSDWSYRRNESYRGIRCNVLCTYSHVDWCDVRNLKALPDERIPIWKHHVGVWRFLPIGDPTVSIAHFRDLDSVSSKRELAAVEEWEKLGTRFHVMRDFQRVNISTTGHSWETLDSHTSWHVGFRAQNLIEDLKIRKIIFNSTAPNNKDEDQIMAKNDLWPLVKLNVTVHDSYHCKMFGPSLPFPTQRENRKDIVGQYCFEGNRLECRPNDHQDWIYC